MKGLNLYLSMMRRRWLGNSLIALLIAVTSVFMLLYPGLIADSEEELEAAYKNDRASFAGLAASQRAPRQEPAAQTGAEGPAM